MEMIAGLDILGGGVECRAWLTMIHQYQLRVLSLGVDASSSRMASYMVRLLRGFLSLAVLEGWFRRQRKLMIW